MSIRAGRLAAWWAVVSPAGVASAERAARSFAPQEDDGRNLGTREPRVPGVRDRRLSRLGRSGPPGPPLPFPGGLPGPSLPLFMAYPNSTLPTAAGPFGAGATQFMVTEFGGAGIDSPIGNFTNAIQIVPEPGTGILLGAGLLLLSLRRRGGSA